MGCCGQKRAEIKQTVAATSYNQTAPHNQQGPAAGGQAYRYPVVALRYLEHSPILVTGSATGRRYEFSERHPLQSVDVRDAQALLRTRFFRQV
jgi:hypothetical protein